MKRKDYYRYFLDECQKDRFNEYLEKSILKSIEENFSREQMELMNSKNGIDCFKIFDVLNNKELSKLIKKINNVSVNKFQVKRCRYKTSNILKKYSYIGKKFETSSLEEIAEIDFIDDDYIDYIEILCSPLDDFRGFIEYSFYLKQAINEENDLDFLEKHISDITWKDYGIHKHINIDLDEKRNYSIFMYIYQNILNIIFQHYITSYLYTNNGKHSFLPSLDIKTYNKSFDFSNYNTHYMNEAYINKNNNYVIERDASNNGLHCYRCDSSCFIDISDHIMYYGLDFYYSLFGNYEIENLKLKLTPQISSIKKLNANIVKELFDIWKSLNSKKETIHQAVSNQWIYTNYSREKKEATFSSNYYKNFYDKYYDYFRVILELKNITISRVLSIVAIIVAFVGIVISLS